MTDFLTGRTPVPGVAFARPSLGIYPVLVAVFCCLLLLSNISATKGIQFGFITTDGGLYLYPLTYIIGDVLAEVYGLRATRRTIWLGFAMSLIASINFWIVIKSPPTGYFGAVDPSAHYSPQQAFETTLGPVPQILLASVCGYLVGEFMNSFVLVKIKQRTREKHLWARLVSSTVVSELFDTAIFCAIAAPVIGADTFGLYLNYAFFGFVYKCGLEIILLPVTYRVIRVIKRREPTYQQAMREVDLGVR